MPMLFCYGTLKRGHGNNRLLVGARFAGEAKTCGLYHVAGGSYPIMFPGRAKIPVQMPGTNGPVRGELYKVSRHQLARCDKLEGHPDWYVRRRIRVELDDGAVMRVNAYIMPFGRLDRSRALIAPGEDGVIEWGRK